MKNELMQVWYRVTFMVTENNARHEYSIFSQGSSESAAAVSAAVAIAEGSNGMSNPSFASIRIATYHEADLLNVEDSDLASPEQKEEESEDE